MNKTITIAAYNRPKNLIMLLQSLKNQLVPLDDYRLFVRIDRGGEHFECIREIANSIDFIETRVGYPSRNEGINLNTYEAMRFAYERYGADYNVYLEDDLILSPDAFNLVEWYIAHSRELRAEVADIGAFCLCNLQSRSPKGADEVFLSRALIGWGFVMSLRQWEIYAEPVWLEGHSMWDNRMAEHIRSFSGVYNAFPTLSRVSNTGRVGAHFSQEKFDKMMQGHVHSLSRVPTEFRFVGIQ